MIELHPFSEARIEAVRAMAIDLHRRSSYASSSLNIAKVLSHFGNAERVPTAYLRLAVDGDELLGFLYGVKTVPPFTDDAIAADLYFVVKPTYRGSVAAISLIANFRSWAVSVGAKKLMLSQSTGIEVDKTRKLYEHLGMKIVGVTSMDDL